MKLNKELETQIPRFPDHWHVDDVPFGLLDPALVRSDRNLFYLIAAASFVEITSDLYAQNLISYFANDARTVSWLRDTWQPQEIQHGVALKRYVEHVWPECHWQEAYTRFYAEYSRCCKTEFLGPTPTLELVARCVVETGTASLYTMIHNLSPEPVLRRLARWVRDDEVHHYRYFYRAFIRYNTREPARRLEMARALFRRIRMIDNEDAYLSFKHAYLAFNPRETHVEPAYKSFQQHLLRLARRHYPYEMAVKMLLKPLGLNPKLRRVSVPLLAVGAKYLRH